MVDIACKYGSHVHGNMHSSTVLLLGKQHCRLIAKNDMSKHNIVFFLVPKIVLSTLVISADSPLTLKGHQTLTSLSLCLGQITGESLY